jgi:hypothetical protein
VGSIDKRLGDLERLVEPPEDESRALRWAVSRDILNEFACLKRSRAVGYRGGVRIEPEDIPGKILGPGYTTGRCVSLP